MMIHATCITYLSSEKATTLGLTQLDVRFLADINSWNVNGNPQNSGTDPREHWASWLLTTFLNSLGHFCSVRWLWTKFQVPIFLFSSLWQHDRGNYNVPTGAENLYGQNLSHIGLSGKFGEMWAKYPLHPQKLLAICFPHRKCSQFILLPHNTDAFHKR